MTRFVTSSPIRPHYESNRYRPSPARREHIFGRIQPSDELVNFGRRIPSGRIACLIALFAMLIFVAHLVRL